MRVCASGALCGTNRPPPQPPPPPTPPPPPPPRSTATLGRYHRRQRQESIPGGDVQAGEVVKGRLRPREETMRRRTQHVFASTRNALVLLNKEERQPPARDIFGVAVARELRDRAS